MNIKSSSPFCQSSSSENILFFLDDFLHTSEYQLVPLAGDASNRRYYRVIQEDQSWVLMEWEPFVANNQYPFLSVLRHFSKNQVQVPAVKSISGERGLVLLEDLGDLTLERKFWENQNQEQSLPFYFQAIDELIKIHYVSSRDKTADCTAFSIAFDTEKFLWEMNYGLEHLIIKLANISLSPIENESLRKIFFDICQKLDNQPKLISHRDYHSRNLMIKLGKMRVIDFQDARMGPIQYDLVSLVHDSYVDLNHSMREKILSYYLDRSVLHGQKKISKDEFSDIFHLQAIQRCFKATGSFASFYNQRSDIRYLKYIHPTLQTVVKYLDFFPSYRYFKNMIVERGLLEMDFKKP